MKVFYNSGKEELQFHGKFFKNDDELESAKKWIEERKVKHLYFGSECEFNSSIFRGLLTTNLDYITQVSFEQISMTRFYLMDYLPCVDTVVLHVELMGHKIDQMFHILSTIKRRMIKNVELYGIHLFDNLDEFGLEEFFDCLINVSSLKFSDQLDLSLLHLSKMMKKNKNLKELSLEFCLIEYRNLKRDKGFKSFFKALSNNRLEKFSYKDECIFDSDHQVFIDHLVNSLSNNSNLKDLKIVLDGNGLCLDNMINPLLKILPGLKSLSVSVNAKPSEDNTLYTSKSVLSSFAEAISRTVNLKKLGLYVELDYKVFENLDNIYSLTVKCEDEILLRKIFENTSIINDDIRSNKRRMIWSKANTICHVFAEESCSIVLSIQRFRSNTLLHTVGRDMTRIISEELFRTYPDQKAWSK